MVHKKYYEDPNKSKNLFSVCTKLKTVSNIWLYYLFYIILKVITN